MAVSSWKVINGVKYVNMDGFNLQYYNVTFAEGGGYNNGLWVGSQDFGEYLFYSGLEVASVALQGTKEHREDITVNLLAGEIDGVPVTYTATISIASYAEGTRVSTVKVSNSYNGVTSAVGNNSYDFGEGNSALYKVIPVYGNADYSRRQGYAYGYVVVARTRERDGRYVYLAQYSAPFTCTKNIGWNDMSNNPDVEDGERGTTDTGTDKGGYGGKVNPTDRVNIPSTPNLSWSATGIRLYTLTVEQMRQFSSWLWTSDWVENLKKLRSNPMDNVISTGIIDNTVTASADTIAVGNVDSGISAGLADSWLTVDCGSVTVDEYYGTFADYSPYASYVLYLPKVGEIPIPADVIVNNTVHVVYQIELVTGQGLCYIEVTNNRTGFTYIYKILSCQCVAFIPLTSSDHTQMMTSFINSVSRLSIAGLSGSAGSVASAGVNSLTDFVTTKNPTEVVGTLSNISSLLSPAKPYILINATHICKPSGYRVNDGYMLYATRTLSDLTGYVKCINYQPSFQAPKNVLDEISTQLNGGVYID